MPMWTCDSESCSRPAVRTLGDCILCNRHLCSYHLQPELHRCPKWEDADAYDPASWEAEKQELTKLIGKIDTAALEARASHLRQGMPCCIPLLQYNRATSSSVMGGMNYHVDVQFQDGITWIARIRRFNATSPPAALRDYILQSEVATLKFLQGTKVPAPKVHDFMLESTQNPVGVGYILMEKLPGKTLRWSMTSPEQKEKVMNHIADSYIELQKFPFQEFGSLDSPGYSHIGPFARETLTDFVGSEMRTIGPVSSLEEYYKSSLELILNQIIREEMYSPKTRAIDAYLIHRFLLDLAPLVSTSSSQASNNNNNNNKFHLKHADDKGDHILVNEKYDVTGIIDWEWAYTAPPALAFRSPIGFLPVADFYKGRNSVGDDEAVFARILENKGHGDLADFVRRGRLHHWFTFCCGCDLSDWDGFLGLFRGLRECVAVDQGLEWEEWRVVALKRYEEDAGLKLLLERREHP